MHLSLCLPCYEGKVSLHWMSAYMRTRDLLTKQNIKFDMITVGGCALIHLAREELIRQSLDSGATHILFVDVRQIWEPVGVLRMLSDLEEVDLVTAPTGTSNLKFCVGYNGKEKGHLKGADHSAISFMGIKRKALQKIWDAYPDLEYEVEEGTRYGVCHPMIENKLPVGEDIAFTLRAVRAGVDIWVDNGIKVKRII